MKDFIWKLIIVLVGIVLLDLGVGVIGKVIINKLNQNNYSGQAALFGYNLESAQADIIILGSSTASCHYNPDILEDSISVYKGRQYTAFNAGAYYQQTPYPYCVLRGVLERRIPEIVILDVQPQQLGESVNEVAMKPMRPYYTINPYVKKVFEENETFINKVLLYSSLYRYNTEIVKLVASFKNPIGANGFDPKDGVVHDYEILPVRDNNELNSVFVSEFERIIKTTLDNNIKLFIVISPRLEYIDKNSKSYLTIVDICNHYNIELIDFTSEEDFKDANLFYDKHHLNTKGANLLTEKTFSYIKNKLESY